MSTARAAPDTTGTIPVAKTPKTAPKTAPATTAASDDETLPPLFELPAAPRARMRACGEKWQGIKMAGLAADGTWRDFATKCLADNGGSDKATP